VSPTGTRVVNKNELMNRSSGEATRRENVSEVAGKSELQLGQAVAKKKISHRPKQQPSEDSGMRSGTNISKKSHLIEKNGNNKNKLIAAVGVVALLTVGYFKFEDKIIGKKEEVAKELRAPSSDKQNQVVDSSSSKNSSEDTYKIILSNFDKYKQKVYLNGEEVEGSFLGEVKIAKPGDFTLRVQTPGQAHFVTKVSLDESNPQLKIKIPTMPYAVFGYLNNSRPCINGKLFFNLFGEERVEALPIANKQGLPFSIKLGPGGEPIQTEYTVFYQKGGEELQRKLTFSMKFENDSIDLCNVLYRQND
jgi:serine/threonine-protein kinase